MPKKTLLLIIIGTLLTSFTMLRSGLREDFGMGFWGPNGHDAIWHLAVANHMFDGLPVVNPVLSGNALTNYHLGYDLILATVSKLTGITTLNLYFRLFPLFIAFLLGFLTFKYTKSNLSVFLIYFAGSFGWIFTLVKDHAIAGESLFWAMQSASTQLNPPFALSLVLLLLGLNVIKRKPLLSGVLFALSTAIKVYSGVLIGLSLLLLFVVNKKKKYFPTIAIHGLLSIIILWSYGAFTSKQEILVFQPFWFTHSLINAVDKLYFPQLATLHYNLSLNPFTYKLPFFLLIELGLVVIFFLGNFAGRLIALPAILKAKTDTDLLLRYVVIIGMIIPIIFIQNGTAWNTIQFLYYSLFFTSLFVKSNIFRKNNLLLVIFIVISCLGSIGTLKDYFGFPPPSAIQTNELEALDYLKNLPNGIVLTYPYDKYQKNKFIKTPIPTYAYESTAYVAAFSQKTTFLEDEVNLSIILSDYQNRLKLIKQFFTNKDIFFNRGFLVNNQIDYIYLLRGQELANNPIELQIDTVFYNELVTIYKVRK